MTDYTARRYIPKGSIKIQDKQSSAVAYLYTSKREGRPCAIMYSGKRGKRDRHYNYLSEENRAKSVTNFFNDIRAAEQRQAERRAKRKEASAKGQGLQVGHILSGSWGYEQTNVEFWEVTALIGKTMVELRKIGQASVEGDPSWAEHVVPKPGEYRGEPVRKRVDRTWSKPSVSFDVFSLSLWEGRPCYQSHYG